MGGLSDTSHSLALNTSLGENNSSKNNNQTNRPGQFLPTPLVIQLAFICIPIVVANALVIYLICKKKTLRTLTNMFLTSLAFSDLISGLVGFLLFAICSLKKVFYVCLSSAYFIRFTAISSVCHVLLIAFDRYICIVHPFRHPYLVTKWRAIVATCFVWLFSFAASVIQLSWYGLNKSVLVKFAADTETIDVVYSKVCIVMFFAVPLILMCYIYGNIFYISFKHIKQDRQRNNALHQPARSLRREWRGNSVLLIMVVIFAGCWLPFFFTMLSEHKKSSRLSPTPMWLSRLLVFLRFIPPLSNPLLCTLLKHDFRYALKTEVFRKILRKLSIECDEEISLNNRAIPVQRS